MAKLSAELQRYFLAVDELPATEAAIAAAPVNRVTLAEILELAGERTFGFLFVLLALPSALPVPAPGYSVPFGIVMLLLAVQLIAGAEQPWFPKNWRQRGFDRKTVKGFITKGIPWLQRIETVSRPRLTPVCTSRLGRIVIGTAIALMSISMMVPIPGTNTLPAIGIFVTGFGLLDDDGAISLAGLVLCAMGGTLTFLILRFGYEAVKQGIEFVRNTVF
ncbi:exopolysaccharide biosynthesis protein [Romeria aff. gracilis LEGE 07310]|uniref:Exopolysaccharide biosynthesis protein n=1 Tax=Vasconcelosia minhoensis LEGE 07310 TaxID=915328 RepID=A0A8J7AFN6_9CYAN|nr:exopolysaccharide biosynthesis protein [Romeria gracilis]MBE9078386.1 exopolysaccharide biosynthesis protein [Romeria aff. gracilis LEGE 07310]